MHNVELKIKQMNKNCKNLKEIKRMWNWNILLFALINTSCLLV
jgi:hypothetical protein